MLNNTNEWSHTRGNAVVPPRWQATSSKQPGGTHADSATSRTTESETCSQPAATAHTGKSSPTTLKDEGPTNVSYADTKYMCPPCMWRPESID